MPCHGRLGQTTSHARSRAYLLTSTDNSMHSPTKRASGLADLSHSQCTIWLFVSCMQLSCWCKCQEAAVSCVQHSFVKFRLLEYEAVMSLKNVKFKMDCTLFYMEYTNLNL